MVVAVAIMQARIPVISGLSGAHTEALLRLHLLRPLHVLHGGGGRIRGLALLLLLLLLLLTLNHIHVRCG